MSAEILLTVAATAIVQSIFGAGVLLFGTPILLLLGHGFVDVLIVLLPVSIAINLLQIVKHHAHIDFAFYRKILFLTLPPIAFFLFLVTHVRVDIGLIVGPFLLFIAFKEVSPALNRAIGALMQYQSSYFIGMGIVHGLSNLGGSLLTALVHHKGYGKDIARVTVAVSYATFAAVQLLILGLFSPQRMEVPPAENGIYLAVGALTFLLADEMLYTGIEPEKYRRVFAGFLAISGAVLLLRSLG